MKIETIIDELERANRWRRGDEGVEMPEPARLGEVIDAAVVGLRSIARLEAEIERWRTATAKLRDGADEAARVANEQLARAAAELAKQKASAEWAHTCIHHTDNERKGSGCPVCAEKEFTALRRALETTRGNILSIKDAVAPGVVAYDEWLRVVDAALNGGAQ